MQVTVERLRGWILVAASLLVVVVVGFLFFANFRYGHLLRDLPGRLGVNIQQTANGFTYSQSSQGHTLYTIHASKLLEYRNGHARLHDVTITLYGPPGSHRADRIYGADFDYEPSTGVASTKGQVSIDIENPTAQGQPNPQDTIHVKTSALTFNSKTDDAETDQYTEFQLPKASGNSVGAAYNSKTGMLVLDRQVVINTVTKAQQPAVIHAAHLNFLRDTSQALLLHAVMDYEQEKSSSDQATIDFRKDGSADHIDAQGHVQMTSQNGAVLLAQTAHIQLDARSQPQQAELGGGLNFTDTAPQEKMHGVAGEATLTFGAQAMLKHAQFREAVSFVDERSGLPGDPQADETRQVHGAKVDIDFVPGPDGKKSIAQKALIQQGASMTLRTLHAKAPEENTTVKGDQLLATLQNGDAIRQLDGFGHTQMVSLGRDGATNTSQGDVLHLTFAPQPATPAGSKGAATGPESQIETAVQDGHVVLVQTPGTQAGDDPQAMTAYAGHAEYHAADRIVHLSGNPRLIDGQTLQLASDQIDYHQDSGDATATGDVKATYLQQSADASNTRTGAPAAPQLGGHGPTHVVAQRAELFRAQNKAFFYGAAPQPARMWQGGDSVWAPVIELLRDQQELKAYGKAAGPAAVVEANFTTALSGHAQSVVRVRSHDLVYSDMKRQGDFHGNVDATDADGTVQADKVVMVLTPAAPKGKSAEGAQTQLDHLVATGHVVIDQPGREGDGAKLVYTARDGKYVLTGEPGARPRMTDRIHGTTTGDALIFNNQSDSVEVIGGKGSAVTDTRVPR
jgi:lipopolysaccharide export system protein LptA